MSGVDAVSGGSRGAGSVTAAGSPADAEDRFLKLLVAQMQNQDPLNPLDNAQVTSQMAQIQSVAGLEKLNTTVGGLNGHLVQLQALQGASLVGREVTLVGSRLAIEDEVGRGGFELAAAADQVKVEILNAAGRVVGQLDLGATGAGRHAFEWPAGTAADADGYRFRVTATAGSASVLKSTLMRDRVEAVLSDGVGLRLDLQHAGTVSYDTVLAIN
ncbi:MAG: flagellar hook assembly protein FlgD [Burkholderiales bacterium]|nr:flagellar hook assembly protein FlgD [Burkholderiales bacterium]